MMIIDDYRVSWFLGPHSLCFQDSKYLPNISRWAAVRFVNGTLAGHGHHTLGDPTDLAIRLRIGWSFWRKNNWVLTDKSSKFWDADIAQFWLYKCDLLALDCVKCGQRPKSLGNRASTMEHLERSHCLNRTYGQLWHIYFEKKKTVSDCSGDLGWSLAIHGMILQAAIKMTSFRKGPVVWMVLVYISYLQGDEAIKSRICSQTSLFRIARILARILSDRKNQATVWKSSRLTSSPLSPLD